MNEAAQTGLLASLGINWMLLLAQAINFCIVLLVLWRWVYRPLVKAMESRSKKIADGLAKSEEAKKLIAEARAEKDATARQVEKERQSMMQAVKAEAEQERQALQAKTQADIDRQLQEARERLKREKEMTLQAVKNEAADLVALAAEKVTAGAIKPQVQRELVADAMKDVAV